MQTKSEDTSKREDTTKREDTNDPIMRLTIPFLKNWISTLPKNILPQDLPEFCRALVPTYSFDRQARAVQIQQGTSEWHLLRANLLTCSNFGSAVGNGYKTKPPDKLLLNMIWPKTEVIDAFGQRAMSWGTVHESDVRNYYEAWMKQLSKETRERLFHAYDERLFEQLSPETQQTIRDLLPMTTLEKLVNYVMVHMKPYQHNDIEIFQVGFCISETSPWCGGSPDGLICRYDAFFKRFFVIGLLEIKCPFTGKFYKEIPLYYRDQIQGFMNMFDIHWCHFVQWVLPGKMQIEQYKKDKDYWDASLFPKLEDFYFARYLPRRVLQHFNLLQQNSLSPLVRWEE